MSSSISDSSSITGSVKTITITPPQANPLSNGYLTISYKVMVSVAPGIRSGIGSGTHLYGVSFGFRCAATGPASVAMGMGCSAGRLATDEASMGKSVAIGRLAIADNGYAMGNNVQVLGDSSVCLGSSSKALNSYSAVLGHGSIAYAQYTYVFGYGLFTNTSHQIVIGNYNTQTSGIYSFIVGAGTSNTARKNSMVLTSSGNMTILGTLTQSSDRRLKKHVAYLKDEAVDFIMSIHPALFVKDNERHLGFYAQDVQDAEPDEWDTCTVSSENMDETLGFEPLTLDYSALIAPLTATVQQLVKKNEELVKQNQQLEERLARLERILLEKGDI